MSYNGASTTVEPTEAPPTDEPTPATDPEPTPAKPKKLKVKADLKPKKLSMIKAALQVLAGTQGADDLPGNDRCNGHGGPVGESRW